MAATPGKSQSASAFGHSVYQPYPGKPAIDVWGWTGVINYQRTQGHATPEQLIELARQANRWGANMIEVMPFKIAPGGYVMSWDADDPIAQPDHGVYFYDDPNWTDEAYRRMFGAWHELDMLAALCVNSIGATWGDIGPGWKRPTGNVEADVMQRWARDFFNRFAYGADGGYLDILDTERVSGMELSMMWSFNPGATPVLCAPSDHHQEGFVFSFCCAGRKRQQMIGLDDRSGYEFDQKYPYFSYQADARARKTLHTWGRFGGYTYPDWIVKQVFDYCRVRKQDGNNLHTALWWFNDVEEMHSPIDKQYIHGVSLDPLRSAVATRLFVTGELDSHEKRLNPEAIGALPARDKRRGSPMLQNNHLALYLSPWKQGGELVVDRGHLGEFHDQHDRQETLTHQLFTVRASDDRAYTATQAALESLNKAPSGAIADAERSRFIDITMFRDSGGYKGRPEDTYAYRHDDGRDVGLPGGMRHGGDRWPANIEVAFDADMGTYVCELEVSGSASLEFWHNNERLEVRTLATEAPQVLPVVFAVSDSGMQQLRMMCWHGELEFKRLAITRLGEFALSQRVVEPGGYMARWEERMTLPIEGGLVREQRQYALVNDGPWLEVDVERSVEGTAAAADILTCVGCEVYDTMRVGDAEHSGDASVDEVPDEVQLVDSSGEAPPLSIALRAADHVVRLSFTPGGQLMLVSRPTTTESLSLVLMVPEGLYTDDQISGRVASAVAHQAATMEHEQPLTVSNELDIPVVRLLQLAGSELGPFYVREHNPGEQHGWWMARGAHASFHDASTYLRVYLQPSQQAVVHPYGFIEGHVKGGNGAQHILAIREDVNDDGCVARVLETTPYIFAPPVEFAKPFGRVIVNGAAWHYYDGNVVYLPLAPGEYDVRTFASQVQVPHIVATQARVTQTHWHDGALTITVKDPPWYDPGVAWYNVGLHCEGRKVSSVTGAGEQLDLSELPLRDTQQEAMAPYAVLKVSRGETTIHFAS